MLGAGSENCSPVSVGGGVAAWAEVISTTAIVRTAAANHCLCTCLISPTFCRRRRSRSYDGVVWCFKRRSGGDDRELLVDPMKLSLARAKSAHDLRVELGAVVREDLVRR